jgi:hypothetical protein
MQHKQGHINTQEINKYEDEQNMNFFAESVSQTIELTRGPPQLQ